MPGGSSYYPGLPVPPSNIEPLQNEPPKPALSHSSSVAQRAAKKHHRPFSKLRKTLTIENAYVLISIEKALSRFCYYCPFVLTFFFISFSLFSSPFFSFVVLLFEVVVSQCLQLQRQIPIQTLHNPRRSYRLHQTQLQMKVLILFIATPRAIPVIRAFSLQPTWKKMITRCLKPLVAQHSK